MIAWLGLSIALSAWVFWPILGVFFHNDDFIHLFCIPDLGFVRFVLEPFAMHSLVVRNAVMYGVFQAFGPDPRASFAIVLLTQALNTGLLFAAIRRLTASSPIAFFGATLFGTAPVLAGSLGWYTCYGHVLAGTCFAALLALLAPAYATGRPPRTGPLVGSAALAVAASACFGTGVGVTAAFPLLVLLPFSWRRSERFRIAVALLVPLIAAAAYFAVAWWRVVGDLEASSGALTATVARTAPGDFLVSIRNLLEIGARELLAGGLGLLHGFVAAPAVWLVYAAALAAAFAWSATATRRLALCLLATAIACYAPIALAKGAISSRMPMLLASEVRYHYVSLMPLSVLLCLGVHALARRWPPGRRLGPWVLSVWLGLLVGSQVLVPRPIDRHDEERQMVRKHLEQIRTDVSAVPAGQPVVLPDRTFSPVRSHLGIGSAVLFLIYHPDGLLDGRPVRFSVAERKLLWWKGQRRRVAELLVAE